MAVPAAKGKTGHIMRSSARQKLNNLLVQAPCLAVIGRRNLYHPPRRQYPQRPTALRPAFIGPHPLPTLSPGQPRPTRPAAIPGTLPPGTSLMPTGAGHPQTLAGAMATAVTGAHIRQRNGPAYIQMARHYQDLSSRSQPGAAGVSGSDGPVPKGAQKTTERVRGPQQPKPITERTCKAMSNHSSADPGKELFNRLVDNTHQEQEFNRLAAQLSKEAERLKLGETGRFPEGKITPDDEGEIRVAIGTVDGKVIINFGKPVNWFGMQPEQARQIAQSMLDKADEIDGIDAGNR